MTEPIHQTTFEELQATLGNDFTVELVETYFAETPGLLDQLHQAFSQGNAAVFQRAAHSIKSTSASFGALDLAAQAKELEMIGRAGDLSGAGEKLAALDESYLQVQQALQKLIANIM
jgi:HPt (histidine-containing phosphotransfer) domain-containing protein